MRWGPLPLRTEVLGISASNAGPRAARGSGRGEPHATPSVCVIGQAGVTPHASGPADVRVHHVSFVPIGFHPDTLMPYEVGSRIFSCPDGSITGTLQVISIQLIIFNTWAGTLVQASGGCPQRGGGDDEPP